MKPPEPIVPTPGTVTTYLAGQAPALALGGDFILTRDHYPWHSKQGCVGGAIRFGSRWHHDKRWCWCNHAAGVIAGGTADQAVLVEMLGHGATVTPLSHYLACDYVLVSPMTADDPRRAQAVSYWNWLSETHVDYGFPSAAAMAAAMMTGASFGFIYRDRPVCSASVAAGLGMVDEWRATACSVLPCDLAERWQIDSPETHAAAELGHSLD